jgi:hypothetical protein
VPRALKMPLTAALAVIGVVATLVVVGPGSASPIDPHPPGVIAVPSVSGLQVGQTLVGVPGTWGGSTPMTFDYIWLRSASSGGGYVGIPGASSLTYTVTEADVGHSLFFQVKATNEDGAAIASSDKIGIVTGATVADTLPLPDGTTSVLVDHVTLPDHLVVQAATMTPATLKRGGSVTARIVVFDRFGHPVRGALVQVIPIPYGAVTKPAETATGNDGSVSVTLKATSQLARAGKLVALYIQARKNGDDLLTGITGTRIVNLGVKG